MYVGHSQCARATGSTVLVVGGEIGNGGLAVSANSGLNFTNIQIPLDIPKGGWVRYGAVVDANTWYVTFGGWPNYNQESLRGTSLHPFSAKYAVDTVTQRLVKTSTLPPSHVQTKGYSALIAKTSDAGKTWTNQFSDNSTYYFNAIDCFDATHCAVVAEGFDTDAGVRVMMTSDGTNWTKVLHLKSNATVGSYSFMVVRYVSATDIWVGGSLDIDLSTTAVIYKSADGGKSWANDSSELKNIETISAMSFSTGGVGYAVVVTTNERATVLCYTP